MLQRILFQQKQTIVFLFIRPHPVVDKAYFQLCALVGSGEPYEVMGSKPGQPPARPAPYPPPEAKHFQNRKTLKYLPTQETALRRARANVFSAVLKAEKNEFSQALATRAS